MESILNLQCLPLLSLVSDDSSLLPPRAHVCYNTDTSITSLAHNLWSRDDHIVVGFSSGEINVYNGLTGSPKLLMSLDDKEVFSYYMQHYRHSKM